jgi:hypothetical protein
LTVRRDDERRAGCQRGREAGRHEEVRVCDVRAEAPCDASCVEEERSVTLLASAAVVDDRALDLVPARQELTLEVRDEYAQIGVVRPRVHLRHEKDAHVDRES